MCVCVAGHSPRPGRLLLGYSLTVFPSAAAGAGECGGDAAAAEGGVGPGRELLLFSASR